MIEDLSRRLLLSATGGLAGAMIGDVGEARAAETRQAGPPMVDRAFARIREGLVHYRHVEPAGKTKALPLYMHHANPGSSSGMEPLMLALAGSRRTIAPDTLGY